MRLCTSAPRPSPRRRRIGLRARAAASCCISQRFQFPNDAMINVREPTTLSHAICLVGDRRQVRDSQAELLRYILIS